MDIRFYRESDADSLWAVLEPAVRAGQTLAMPLDMTQAEALQYWLDGSSLDAECGMQNAEANRSATKPLKVKEVYVAELDGEVVGTYFLRPNQKGGGDHFANGGYVTLPSSRGKGVARAMCAHSIERAKELGYRAIQYNFVVSTNERAVKLWHSFGFEIVGRLPGAFNHATLGYVDALVMVLSLRND